MSRRKNRARQNTKRPKQTATSNVTSSTDEEQPEQLLAKVEAAAMSEATEADLESVASTPSAEPGASAVDLAKRASKALTLLEVQRKRAATVEEEFRKKDSALVERLRAVDQEKKTLEARKVELEEKDAKLTERDGKLLRRQEDIVRRELDADAGFSQRNREALSKLEIEGEELREQFSRHRRQIDEERSAFEEDLQTKRAGLARELLALRQKAEAEMEAERDAFDAELAEARTQLEKERATVAAEAKHVREEKRNVELETALLAEDREAFEDKVEQCAARDIETKGGREPSPDGAVNRGAYRA